jgi:hypothetical protein
MRAGILMLLLALATPTKDDLYVLTNGDRISGKTLSKTKVAMVVQTAYGRLTLPRTKIERIVWSDGHEEIVNVPPVPPPPPEPSLHLALTISGQAFWQAWSHSPKGKELDPTLRLDVRLDDEPIATYVDSHLDPGDLPGPIVNSFSFSPGEVSVKAVEGVVAEAPETQPGRSVLKLKLNSSRAGKKRLVLAYQVNEGTPAEPTWHDLVAGDIEVDLEKGSPTEVLVQQERGRMDYSGLLHKKMRNIETFRVDVHAQGSSPGAEAPEPSPKPSS